MLVPYDLVPGFGNSTIKTGISFLVYLFSALIFAGGFHTQAWGQNTRAIDSAYIIRIDSLLSSSGLKRPNLKRSSLEDILRQYASRDDLSDSWRLGIYNILTDYLCELNRCDEALDLYNEALNDSSFLGDSCLTGRVLVALADLYSFMNDFQKSESLLVKALPYFTGCSGKDEAALLKNLGQLYLSTGQYDKAESHFLKAIRIFEVSGDAAVNDLTYCLIGLAHLYKLQAKFRESESTYLEALALSEKYHARPDTGLLPTLLSLGGLYITFEQIHKGEEILQRARMICDSTIPPNHPYRAGLYTTMGVQYELLGKYREAAKYLRESIEIYKTYPVQDVQGVATSSLWLAKAELAMGNYDTAIALFEETCKSYETTFSKDHPHQASAYTNLSNAYLMIGDFGQATHFIDSALTIYRKTLGEAHPYYGMALVRKGEILNASGQYDQAKECLLEGIANLESNYDPYHQRLVSAIECLARTCCSTGDIEAGQKYYREFLARRLKFIEYAFSFSSDEQKLRWVKNHPVINNSLISLAVDSHYQPIVRDACTMVLKGKGIVIDALATLHETAYCSYDSSLIELVKRHRRTCETIVAMTSIAKFHESDIYRKDTIEVLYQEKDSLENELSKHCSRFSDLLATLRFNLDDIIQALSRQETLLEYIRYTPYDFKNPGNQAQRSGPPRYAVFIVSGQDNVTAVDLGAASEVDSLVHSALAMIHSTGVEVYTPLGLSQEQQLRRITGKLYEIVLAPISRYLEDRETIFVSPDGALNLFPFEILSDSDSTYVIEHLHIQYLSSGRDLIRRPSSVMPAEPYALLVADPDLNAVLAEGEGAPRAISPRSNEKTRFCPPVKYIPLPNTRYEATEIAGYFRASHKLGTTELYGDAASEQNLKNLNDPPQVFHIATHGVFCADTETAEGEHDYNPMLRTGLALAGANSGGSSPYYDRVTANDGVLYAMEIASLNLQNTELAVLSACETGSGEVLDGEGVFGLRRAFQEAGVQALVMSLWTVPDRETSHLIAGFYKRWLEGMSKSESLRQSALEILREQRLRRGNGHPYYWGGFILVGASNDTSQSR